MPDLDPDAFELLSRPHGVPSMLLDWSESPDVASFFAVDGSVAAPKTCVAIRVLDRAVFQPRAGVVDWIDDQGLLLYNRRALQQKGLFTRIMTGLQPVEQMLSGALTKLLIPTWELMRPRFSPTWMERQGPPAFAWSLEPGGPPCPQR